MYDIFYTFGRNSFPPPYFGSFLFYKTVEVILYSKQLEFLESASF